MGYKLTITNEGAALIASVTANQGTLTFTEMRFSETNYVGSEQTLTEGSFSGVFVTASEAASVVDSTTIRVSAHFDNSGITGDHPLYSIGIIGTDGNTTALIGVSTTSDPEAVIREPIPATSISDYVFNTNVTVSNTNDITVVGTVAGIQYEIMSTPLVIDGNTETTVEGALGALNTYSDKIKDNLSNRNLVDNGWFTINQRGAGTITSGYGADRWKMVDGSSATFSSSGVTMIAQLNNYFEDQLPNGVYTASIKYADGTIESGTLTKSNDTDTIRFIQRAGLTLEYAAASKFFYIYTDVSTSIRAVKLEVGSVSTLHLDVAPDPTTELLKCQRYFQRIAARENYAILATGVMEDATTLWGQIPLTVPLRGTPTVSTAGTFNIRHGGVLNSISSITLELRSPTMLSFFAVSSTNLTAGTPAQLLFNSTSAYIDLSADL